jgi:hypothetical protein
VPARGRNRPARPGCRRTVTASRRQPGTFRPRAGTGSQRLAQGARPAGLRPGTRPARRPAPGHPADGARASPDDGRPAPRSRAGWPGGQLPQARVPRQSHNAESAPPYLRQRATATATTAPTVDDRRRCHRAGDSDRSPPWSPGQPRMTTVDPGPGPPQQHRATVDPGPGPPQQHRATVDPGAHSRGPTPSDGSNPVNPAAGQRGRHRTRSVRAPGGSATASMGGSTRRNARRRDTPATAGPG